MTEKGAYLGDGVYVTFDGYSVVLTTANGTVFLDPDVLVALITYCRGLGLTLELPREERSDYRGRS
jgi:hypothetical protein